MGFRSRVGEPVAGKFARPMPRMRRGAGPKRRHPLRLLRSGCRRAPVGADPASMPMSADQLRTQAAIFAGTSTVAPFSFRASGAKPLVLPIVLVVDSTVALYGAPSSA